MSDHIAGMSASSRSGRCSAMIFKPPDRHRHTDTLPDCIAVAHHSLRYGRPLLWNSRQPEQHSQFTALPPTEEHRLGEWASMSGLSWLSFPDLGGGAQRRTLRGGRVGRPLNSLKFHGKGGERAYESTGISGSTWMSEESPTGRTEREI